MEPTGTNRRFSAVGRTVAGPPYRLIKHGWVRMGIRRAHACKGRVDVGAVDAQSVQQPTRMRAARPKTRLAVMFAMLVEVDGQPFSLATLYCRTG